jgi:hypothetical protein
VKTEADLFTFYQTSFKPIYSDLTAVLGKKVVEVDIQVEAAMSHLAVAKTSADPNKIQSNIDDAHGHIVRASLDAAKLLWLNRQQRAAKIMNDGFKRKWCSKGNEADLMALHEKAEKEALLARKTDVNSEDSREACVALYYAAAAAYQDVLDSIDWSRLAESDRLKFSYIFKQQLGGLIVGFIGGVLSTLAVNYWTSSSGKEPSADVSVPTPAKSAGAAALTPATIEPKK